MAEPAWSPCLLTVNPVFLPLVQILASLVRKLLGISQACLLPRLYMVAPHFPQGFSPIPSWTLMNLPLYPFPPHRTWLHPEAQSAQGCGHTHQETIKGGGMEQGSRFKGHVRRISRLVAALMNIKSREHHILFSGSGFQGVILFLKDEQLY